jgi:hypothetical protein
MHSLKNLSACASRARAYLSRKLSVAHTVRVDDAVLARVLVLDAIAEAEASLVAGGRLGGHHDPDRFCERGRSSRWAV